MKDDLRLLVLDNFKEFGEKVNKHLQKFENSKTDYIVPIEQVRFSNGEGKVVIKDTIREKAVFILSDVGNHRCTYKLYDYTNHLSPDDHFQDIKRVITAISGNASKIVLITPLLYASRQHKRKARESLDCAIALQELERLGIKSIVTFDAHDPNVQNAIPCLSFENFYPTHLALIDFINKEKIDFNNILVISPDAGAVDRARYYADMLRSDVGVFNKRRDLSIIIDGKNPVVSHEYIGKDVKGKDIIVVDDMIASGDSILEVVKELKKRKANNIFIFCTFAFFTKGTDAFYDAFNKGDITRLYTTNLSYIPNNIAEKPWVEMVDCSEFVANIIHTLYNHKSISPLLNGKEKVIKEIQKKVGN